MTGQTLPHVVNKVGSWVPSPTCKPRPPQSTVQSVCAERVCGSGAGSHPVGRRHKTVDPEAKARFFRSRSGAVGQEPPVQGRPINSPRGIHCGAWRCNGGDSPAPRPRLVRAGSPRPAVCPPPFRPRSNRHRPAAPAAKTPANSGFACLPPSRMSRRGRCLLTEPATGDPG